MYNSLDNIKETTLYLSQTIEDFRGYFDPKTNNINKFYISSLIKKVTKLLTVQYKSKAIKIIEEIEDYELSSNENELMQVLINIINNARDALEPVLEDKFIIIKTKKIDNQHIIEIFDNAGGIEEQILDKVFDPYFTTKHKSQGTGIGLYMPEQIITKHLNGSLSIENKTFKYKDKEYKGACFKIVI